MKGFDILTLVLMIIGGLNWGLVGFFNFDLVSAICGAGAILSHVIYCLFGLSAVYEVVSMRFIQRRWHLGHFAPTA